MYVVNVVVTTVLETAGALFIAAALAWAFWAAFKLVHHPQWGPVVAFLLVGAVTYPWLRTSELAQTLVLFSALAAVAGWVSPSSSQKSVTGPLSTRR